MAGVKGRSGRKRNVRNIQKYYNEQFDLRSASLIEKLLTEAEEGNATALVYAFDRRLGKPKASTELDVKGLQVTAIETRDLFILLAEERRRLESGELPELIEGEIVNDIQRQGVTEGND